MDNGTGANGKKAWLLTALCWFFYFSLVLGRHGLSVAMPDMVASGLYTKAELGRVASCYFFAYAVMKLPSGLLGDRVSAPLMMIAGAVGAGVSNLLFAAARSAAAMSVCWAANGFFQAFVWSSMMRIIAVCTEDPFRTTAVLLLNATTAAGILAAYAVSALLSGAGWKPYFIISGAFLLLMAAAWLLFGKRLTGSAPVGAVSSGRVELPFSRMKKEYLRCGLFAVLPVAVLHGMLKDGFATWVPTYLTEVFSMPGRSALVLSMVMPVVNLGGLFVVQRVTRRGADNEISGIAAAFFCTAVVSGIMAFAVAGSLPGTVVCFAVVTALMQAINAFFTSLIPMQFRSSGLVSTTAGVIDASIYIGSSCSGILFGSVSEHSGWNGTRLLWLAISVLGCVLAPLVIKKWTAYKKSA